MRTLALVMMLVAGLALIQPGALSAQSIDKGPSCQEQLLVQTTHGQILSQKRGDVESQLAQVAAQASVLQQKLHLVMKENAELKAKIKQLAAPASEQDNPKE